MRRLSGWYFLGLNDRKGNSIPFIYYLMKLPYAQEAAVGVSNFRWLIVCARDCGNCQSEIFYEPLLYFSIAK